MLLRCRYATQTFQSSKEKCVRIFKKQSCRFPLFTMKYSFFLPLIFGEHFILNLLSIGWMLSYLTFSFYKENTKGKFKYKVIKNSKF